MCVAASWRSEERRLSKGIPSLQRMFPAKPQKTFEKKLARYFTFQSAKMFVRTIPSRCMPKCSNGLHSFIPRRRFVPATMRAPFQPDVVLRFKMPSNLPTTQSRSLFSFLNHAWNRRDDERIKEVGPDKACAEWVLRCSGSVRFDGRENWTGNYNALASAGSQVHVVAIDFTKACVTDEGFDYLQNLKNLRSIKLHSNHDISDTALYKLSFVKDTLENLQITACSNVSNAGIESVTELPKLKELYLANLPRVKDLQATVTVLKEKMQQCEVYIKTALDGTAEPPVDNAEHAGKRKSDGERFFAMAGSDFSCAFGTSESEATSKATVWHAACGVH